MQTPQRVGEAYAEPVPPTEAELAELRASNPPNQVTEVVGVMMESADEPIVPSDPKPHVKKPVPPSNPPIEVNRRTRAVRVLPRPEPVIDEPAEAERDASHAGETEVVEAVSDEGEQAAEGGTRTPGLGVNFEGLFSAAVSPGDPDVAAGTTTLVSACNSTNHYRLHDKAGVTIATATQTSLHGITSIGDARAIFDPGSQRYFVMALVNSCTPQIAVAISKTSTPDDLLAGAAADRSWLTWTFTLPGAGRLPDFPEIGVDENAIYLTGNMFNCPALNTYLGVTLMVIPKAQLLAGAASPTSTAFQNLTETWSGNAFQAFTVVPTVAYGSPGIGILGDFTATGTVDDGEGHVLNATFVTLYLVNNPGSGAPTLSDVPVFLQSINTTAPPNVPQSGSATTLRNNGFALHPMTYRDGSLWMCHSARISAPTRSRIDWAEVDAFKAMDPAQFLLGWDQGGPVQNASRYYWFPKITADKAGNAGMVMNGGQSTEFGSVYYATRASTDAADTFQAPLLMKAGVAAYSDGGNPSRWGDYSGISVDPVDGLTFWATSQWAKAAGTWSSWIGAFTMTAETTTLPFFDNFETPGLAPGLWALNTATVDAVGTSEPSGANSVRFNGAPRGQDTLRTRQIDLTGLADVEVSYWVERGGGGGDPPEAADLLSVDYVANDGNWANLNLLIGTGAAEGSYTQFTHVLPADAYHAGFRLRFSSATAFIGDDWFVDDVGIDVAGVPTGACCNAGACTVETDPDCTSGGGDYQGDDVPCSPGLCVPASTVTATISRRANPSGTRGGNCDAVDNTAPFKVTEPHSGGISEVRIDFDVAPGGGGSGWSVEESTCAVPAYAPYSGAAVGSGSVFGTELVISFSPALENARTYRVSLDATVTTIGGQSVEVRGLVADATGDGFVNAGDRSAIVGIWTGSGFSCVTDITNDGTTNAGDRSAVVGAWTGPQNCAP